MPIYENDNVLCHHGIKGQKWGIRRFQNDDGTLTADGKARVSSAFYNGLSKGFDIGSAPLNDKIFDIMGA